ncbi:MAG: glycoside hydrolase family 92 protein [Sphingobacteriales bacterium]|nr:glycoside hydrolase family 92 protein [Sphingobacteriales bacterium]OJV98373.1 MAG: hypothetical protein BGO52_11330 [Sphingobacteriales bacterium 44-61]
MKIIVALIGLLITSYISAQKDINVFLGTSGDHGQLSPAASYPFSMLSIGPLTYPSTHTGYEYRAKDFLGFTHNRMEGVGCMGSGGAILITPFTGSDATSCRLDKKKENGEPGYYHVQFTNDIDCSFAVDNKKGVERYIFPKGKKGLGIDFSSALMNGFVSEAHEIFGNEISGWLEAGTTCRHGKYKLYYALRANKNIEWKENGDHVVVTQFPHDTVLLHIAFSSVSVEYARASLSNRDFADVQSTSKAGWQKLLNAIEVEGNLKEANLFYSLLYRVLQSPYEISESNGGYRAIDGSVSSPYFWPTQH